MNIRKILTSAVMGVMCGTLLAVNFDRFVTASDGEVIGVLQLGKEKLNITGTIKEVTWTATNGQSIVLKWDGKTLTQEKL